MSNKLSNIVIALGTATLAILGVLTYMNSNQTPNNVKEPINKEDKTLDSVSVKIQSKPEKLHDFNCVNYLAPITNSVKKLSYSSEINEVYLNTIPKLIEKQCLKEALDTTSLLQYSTEQDIFHKKISLKAIETKQFQFAEMAIEKLSYSAEQDEIRKILIKAASQT